MNKIFSMANRLAVLLKSSISTDNTDPTVPIKRKYLSNQLVSDK